MNLKIKMLSVSRERTIQMQSSAKKVSNGYKILCSFFSMFKHLFFLNIILMMIIKKEAKLNYLITSNIEIIQVNS